MFLLRRAEIVMLDSLKLKWFIRMQMAAEEEQKLRADKTMSPDWPGF